MPRPKTDTVQITVRVPTAWIRDADALSKGLCLPGMNISRTDVFRMAIAQGLIALRLELGKKAGKK